MTPHAKSKHNGHENINKPMLFINIHGLKYSHSCFKPLSTQHLCEEHVGKEDEYGA